MTPISVRCRVFLRSRLLVLRRDYREFGLCFALPVSTANIAVMIHFSVGATKLHGVLKDQVQHLSAVRCRHGENLQTSDNPGARCRHDHARRPVLNPIHCQTPLPFSQHDQPRTQAHQRQRRLRCQPGPCAMSCPPPAATTSSQAARRRRLVPGSPASAKTALVAAANSAQTEGPLARQP